MNYHKDLRLDELGISSDEEAEEPEFENVTECYKMLQNSPKIQTLISQRRSATEPSCLQGNSDPDHHAGQETGDRPGMEIPTGEVPVYCDCCPQRPKKMAVIQPHAIQIISRRSGRKHIARIPIRHRPSSSPVLGLTGVGKMGLQLRSGHSNSVIPSVARNLKSITARPDGQGNACIVTENQTG